MGKIFELAKYYSIDDFVFKLKKIYDSEFQYQLDVYDLHSHLGRHYFEDIEGSYRYILLYTEIDEETFNKCIKY